MPLPEQDFIFVDVAPGVPGVEIGAGAIGDGFPLGDYNPATPITAGAQYSDEFLMSREDKFDGIGNVWVEGEMTGGNLTIAADRLIIITGDLTTQNDQTDLLGLMAGEAIEMMSPVMQTVKAVSVGAGKYDWDRANATKTGIATGWPSKNNQANRRVEAALYAAAGSFRVQNSNFTGVPAGSEPLGTLRVFGSLAQNFVGVAARASSKSICRRVDLEVRVATRAEMKDGRGPRRDDAGDVSQLPDESRVQWHLPLPQARESSPARCAPRTWSTWSPWRTTRAIRVGCAIPW